MLALERGDLVLVHHPPPDPPAQRVHRAQRLGLQQDAAAVDDGHARAQLTDVLHDVRGQDDDAVLAQLAEQVEEAHALGRIQAGGGLVHDQQARIAQQRHRHAETLAHAARIAAELALARLPQVRPAQQRLAGVLALAAVHQPLQDGEVVEQRFRRHPRNQSEVLRQVTKRAPHRIRFSQGIDGAESHRAGIRRLQRGQRAHQRGLARTIGPQQAVHALRDGQADVVEGADAVGVGLGEVLDPQFKRRCGALHAAIPASCPVQGR